MSAGPSLEALALELYTGPLAEFISSRNALAKETTDAAVAARIRELRKPSVAAWVVNVFAKERSAQLDEALQLAAELREAQADLDARALAQLGRDRRALTRRLATAAAELVTARGEKVTPSTLEAVTQTIAAAFFDEAAAAAVASGRLVRELEPAGTFADIVDTLVAGGPPASPAPAARPPDEVKARRERKEAERVLHDAEQAQSRAERAATKADRASRQARERIAELEARAEELRAELAAVGRDLETSRSSAERAETEQAEAVERVSAAVDARAEAQRTLDTLTRSR